MELLGPTGLVEKPDWQTMSVDVQTFFGILKATVHHHLHQQNNHQPNGDSRRCSARSRSRIDSTLVCSSSCNAWPTSKCYASSFEYATTASSLPQCSRRPRVDRTATRSKPRKRCVRQLVENRHSNNVEESRSNGFTHAICDDNAVAHESKLCDNSTVACR